MKKVLKKISKTMLIVMLLLALDISLVANCVQAVDQPKEKVYEIDYCDKILKYKGIPRGAVYVVYEENGMQYPAYCINPEKIGVGETDAYNVTINGYITDAFLWRIITNGYPYKSLEQLGVANKKEAYLATKQAIYCYLDNRNVNEYSGIGESGERTLKALKQIWNNAQNSNETKISNQVDIISNNSEWAQDNLNNKYVSKTYEIKTPAPISEYIVELQGENLPEGLIIANLENIEQKTFKQGEKFKLLVPVNILRNAGSFKINVKTKMETKPVLYGVSENKELQNYALTTFSYEDSEGIYYEQYQENEAQITILKREKESKTPLEGVEFQLLDSNLKVVYQNLITDEKGEIILKNVNPGTYYLKEVKTLPGYVLYNENIKIDIHLNEKVNVIVNNSKEKRIEVSEDITNIEVGKTQESTQINSTNINQEINDATINQETNNLNVSQKINNINVEQKLNIQKLPKTGM